jgi:alpha-D-ribose 1-methylphosphonate 5-triphosphate diphosphatase
MDGVWTEAATRLVGARLVLADRVVPGGLRIEGGMIAEVLEGDAAGGQTAENLDGDVIIPGIVDIHTDHVEKHLIPRAHAPWDPLTAVMAHDAQIVASGTTTVFDSLSVGASLKNPERRQILAPLLDALERASAEGLLRADHWVHLRCELSDPETPGLVDAAVARPLTRLMSVMDHAPGDRQSPDIARWISRSAAALDMSVEEATARAEELIARARAVGPAVRAHCAKAAARHGLALMSHDDASAAHVAQAVAEGGAISEFPTTLEAAQAAKDAGLAVAAGAPNFLRGGSQSGNVAVRDLLAEGLVDVLASDYVPRSPLDAAFGIAEDAGLGIALPEAVAMATRAPALAAGMADRGVIAEGMRADLVRVRRIDGRSWIRAVWRGGRRVL